MKAAVYYETGGPEVFRYEELPDPPCPPDGIVADVQAISIEGGDVLRRSSGTPPTRPFVGGYQAAGVVREVGPQVTDLAPGMRVVMFMWSGSHASVAAVPARHAWVVPDSLDIREAAPVPVTFGTADDCLFEFGRLRAGESVLVHGAAGGVGLAAVQLAKAAGATVFATASSEEKLRRLKGFGVDHGINYRERNFVEAVKELTDGKGIDLIVDTVGSTLQQSIEAASYRGRIITAGNMDRGDRRVDIGGILSGNKSLIGVFLGAEMDTERVHSMIARRLADVAAGRLTSVVDRAFPLSEAAAAHAYVESRQAFGRVLLIP